MEKIILVLVFSSIFFNSNAQQSATVIPPSPDAAALAIYGNIPVSTYTGVPNINIPIHTISYRDVQIPVNLSYHASGITVEQDASWVGLAWTLNVGGVITRTVKGGDDLQFSDDGYSNIGNPGGVNYKGFPYETVDETSTLFRELVCQKEIDTEPDIFYFNFSGKSGSFVLEQGQNQSLSYVSGTPLRMEKIDIRYDKATFTWIIKTPDGFAYYFNTVELTETHNGTGAYGQGPERAFFDPSTKGFYSADDIVISAWYLDKIVSPLGEEVNYVYDVTDITGAPGIKNSRYGSARISITDLNRTETYPNGFGFMLENECYFPPGQTSVTKIFTNHIYLKEINHALGKIVFTKSLRDDMMPASSGLGTFNYLTNAPSYLTWIYNQQGPQKLDNIIFQDKNGSVIKKFEFVYSYFNGGAVGTDKYNLKRLKLEKVRECGNSVCNPYYQFYYDETFPMPSKYTNAQDFWGYYNGAHTNPSRIPFGTYLDLTEYKHYFLGDADRQPNPTYMKCATLNKIIYPTGGTTEFEFEPHDYNAFGNDAFMLTDFENNIPVAITGLVTTQNDASAFQTINFTITDPQAEISVNSVMTYYASANSSDPCNVTDPGTIYVGNEPWYSIKKTTETNVVTERQMVDFLNFFIENYNNHCVVPATPDAIDPVRRKKETHVLTSGTYELKVYRRQGFNIEVNVHKTVIRPRTIGLNSNNVYAKTAGGLRIKKIISKESVDATSLIKKYDYTFDLSSQSRTSSGRLMLFPNYHTLYYCTQGDPGFQPIAILGSSWSNTPLGNSASGSIVGYDKVIESDGENYENGYTEFYFNNQEEEGPEHTNRIITGLPAKTKTSNGLLREVKHFDKNEQLLKSETTIYGLPQFQKQVKGVATKNLYMNWMGQFQKWNCTNVLYLVTTEPYPVISDRWVPEKKTTRVYTDATNYLETVTDYVFDTQTHLQLKSEQTTSSKAETVKTEYLYPPEASWIPTGMWQSKYMYDKIVQKKTIKNNQLMDTYKAYYSSQAGTYLLDKEEVAVGAATLESINSYNYLTNGNINQITTRSGISQTYLWNYNSAYPVAQVTNATNIHVAYTSFEADDKGNWTYTGTPIPDPASPTGKKIYSIVNSANNITKNGLSTTTTYIVSYWKKSGTVNVNGTSPATGKTVNGWTYYEHKITNPSGGLITVSGTNGVIDELRLYPATAQMVTYTYEPLIGMTSQCDEGNHITYYEYDSFGRLMLVRDQGRNILKKLCYNYAGQPEQCNFYQSAAINGNYYSQNCSSGQSPVAYYVSVPQGMFISYVDQPTANQLAQQYAQNQANQFGTCQILDVSVYGENNHGTNITIKFHNVASGQNYYFTVYPHDAGTLGNVPPGTYDITLTPNNPSGWYNYSVGCGYWADGPGAMTFYSVSISSGCNNILID
ncbi:MAG TPA: hypothetical protein PLL71_04155 [Agriterribacter sp.]|nr:hypothetical protein [Agriterribacter sp.]HRQ49373.1 hypothetical protein [Agriterribacter sp.]